ncbi:MAG: serine hydrolase [Lachnospiraceae bacterium]|nr:class A beta-lactamase-related serine hydrolase [Robinsoniella sp.]MDY3766233.1 serine hydrolase [Lachnospiraceae bacterium]
MVHPKLTLEKRIEAELASYDGMVGIYVNDLKGNVIDINGEEVFETASSIKAFILACLYEEVEQGRKRLDDMLTCDERYYINGSGLLRSLDMGVTLSVKNTAILMIIVSDNIATNMIIDYLGIDTINHFIKKTGFAHTVLHNPINFAIYPQLGSSTPEDYGKFFELLAQGKLVSEHASEEMMEIFKKQHYNRMLTKDLPQYLLDSEDTGDEELITVASKSGSMDACRIDGGIVSTPYGSYVIVLMHKKFHDPLYYADHQATVYGAKISRLIFDQYMALEGRLRKEA